MRIGLIYDVFAAYPWRYGDPPDADAEYEPEGTVAVIEEALRLLDYQPVRIGTAYDLFRSVHSLRLDAALSIAEGARSRNREAYAPVLLEMADIPYLGSDALTMSVSLDKACTKDLAAAAGVFTPAYRVYRAGEKPDPADLPGPFPLFVKPRYEGSSKGIIRENKVSSLSELTDAVVRITGWYNQDALVEPFIEGGGEFTVCVVGNDPPETLPAVQRAVERTSKIGLHALEHRGNPAAEWSYELEGLLTPALEDALRLQALRVFEKLECRDFARADFRVDAQGTPWFIEINPLPTFAPDGTFAVVAELLGRPYPVFLAEILAAGLNRIGRRKDGIHSVTYA